MVVRAFLWLFYCPVFHHLVTFSLLGMWVVLAGSYEHCCLSVGGHCLGTEPCLQGSVGQWTGGGDAQLFSKVVAPSEIPTSSVSSGATSFHASARRQLALFPAPGG